MEYKNEQFHTTTWEKYSIHMLTTSSSIVTNHTMKNLAEIKDFIHQSGFCKKQKMQVKFPVSTII